MKYIGRVKFYIASRAFGFIVPDSPIPNINGDIFFHLSSFDNLSSIKDDSKVEFEIQESKKGIRAINCVLL